MNRVISGTTPTITYTFSDVNVANIVTAYLTIKKDKNIVLEKTLADATVGDGTLSWHFSQEDTLTVGAGDAKIMCNTVLSDGTRTASAETDVKFLLNHKMEVI